MNRSLSLIALAAAWCVFASPAHARIKNVPCGASHAETRVQTHKGRVYIKNGRAYGCRRGIGAAYLLGRDLCSDSCDGFSYARLAGAYVASVEEFTDRYADTGSFRITVRDLRDGRVLATEQRGFDRPSDAFLETLVLDPRGRIAYSWVSRPAGLASPSHTELWRGPGCGPQVVSALTSSPAKLSLDGGTLRFTEPTGRRATPLCVPAS